MKKLEEILFYVFLIAIPFSVRHIFGYEAVGFMEWQVIAIYATDILLAVLLGFWAFNARGKLRALRFEFSDWALVVFIGVSSLSISHALDVHVAWYHWLKLVEGALLYWYVKSYVLKRFSLMQCFEALVIGGVVQAVIAIPQFMVQHSLGLRYLGESVLSPGMSGIAAFMSHGDKIIRAYGTTVHSNVLAAYLFLALFAFVYISIYGSKKWQWYVFHAATLWAFMLTFSRTIIFIWAANMVARVFLIRFSGWPQSMSTSRKVLPRMSALAIITLAVPLVFVTAYPTHVQDRWLVSSADESVQLRGFYNRETLSEKVHLLGVGPGNFVPWLMRQPLPSRSIGLPAEQYQPVHNIYLLMYAETGILGVATFLAFLFLLIWEFARRTRFREPYHVSFILVFGSLLVFGLFDHFLWTIQTGQLLFWLTAGLLAATTTHDHQN